MSNLYVALLIAVISISFQKNLLSQEYNPGYIVTLKSDTINSKEQFILVFLLGFLFPINLVGPPIGLLFTWKKYCLKDGVMFRSFPVCPTDIGKMIT